MLFKIGLIPLVLLLLIFSCTNNGSEANDKKAEVKTKNSTTASSSGKSAINRDSISHLLQGKWREAEYPFRLAQFENNQVKFIEEGIAASPAFKEYNISNECPFEVNNISNAGPNDHFLVIPGEGRCEILTLANDTLILGGFSTNTNTGYQIIYQRVKE